MRYKYINEVSCLELYMWQVPPDHPDITTVGT